MNNIIKTIVTTNMNLKWHEVNIGNLKTTKIITMYNDIVMSIGVDTGPVIFNLKTSFKDELEKYDGLLLDFIKDKKIPLGEQLERFPTNELRSIFYSDLGSLGYKIMREVPSDISLDTGRSSSNSLQIICDSRGAENYIKNNCLITINGYAYRPVIDLKNKIVIKNGMVPIQKKKTLMTGLISFESLGGIKTAPILPENILKRDNRVKLFHNLSLKIKHMEGYTPILVMCGYLMSFNDVIANYNNNGVININLNLCNYYEKIMRAIEYLDFSGLGIDTNKYLSSGVDKSLIDNDVFIRSLLTMENSFIIYVGNTNLNTEIKTLSFSEMENVLYVGFEPTLPLIDSDGYILDYIKSPVIYDSGEIEWVMNAGPNSIKRKYLASPYDVDRLVPKTVADINSYSEKNTHFLDIFKTK